MRKYYKAVADGSLPNERGRGANDPLGGLSAGIVSNRASPRTQGLVSGPQGRTGMPRDHPAGSDHMRTEDETINHQDAASSC
jgi:hypothetical protein